MDIYVKRLLREWNKYKNLIIACDYDDTLIPFNLETTSTYDKVLKLLLEAQEIGSTLIINTASIPERYFIIENKCKELGLKIYSINQPVTGLPFGHWGKVYANIYLDDRAGLNESLNILEETIKLYKEI